MSNFDRTNQPPLSREISSEACNVAQPYLGIIDDLPIEQARKVMVHVKQCPRCATELERLRRATQFVASLPITEPSANVDKAIRAAIAAHEAGRSNIRDFRTASSRRKSKRKPVVIASSLVAVAAAVAIALFTFHNPFMPAQTAFALPGSVNWDGYVLHYTVPRQSANGQYNVECYQDLGKNQLHAEAKGPNGSDVVIVGNDQKMVALDKSNQTVQLNADGWKACESAFNLNDLRQGLQSSDMKYAGKSTFKNQEVYQVKDKNGNVLLLDAQYRPVNVLQGGNASPIYATSELMQAKDLPESTWDTNVPTGFKVGKIDGIPE